jgi:ribosomal silencing factor RsfS
MMCVCVVSIQSHHKTHSTKYKTTMLKSVISRHASRLRHCSRVSLRSFTATKGDGESTDETSGWIQPERPLVGDLATTSSAAEPAEHTPASDESSIDWLRTRRSKLGIDMQVPAEGTAKKHDMGDIPVKDGVLFSKEEIGSCLESLGGRDITAVFDNVGKPRMGGGVTGMMFVTAVTNPQLRLLADALVRQMRRRNLQNHGVLGAQEGPEGSDSPNETWFVVDCGNFIVHIQDEKTRKATRLQELWSGKDGMHKLNLQDEDAVEDWIAANPVPKDYGDSTLSWEQANTVRQLEKSQWTVQVPHKRVVPRKASAKPRRVPRKS